MLTYENIKSNYDTIKEMCEKYRKELTVLGGVVSERFEACNCSDYIKFMNELPFEEFIGNYFSTLLNNDGISIYREILNGELTFEDYVEETFGDFKNDYFEELNKF